MKKAKVVIASQRLPVQFKEGKLIPSDGGLVSAIQGAGIADDCTWVGCLGPGVESQSVSTLTTAEKYLPIPVGAELYDGFYNGFCNQVLWPAFHDRVDLVNYQQMDWLAYRRANRRFAEAIVQKTPAEIPVWIHDYHLALVPQMIKELQPKRKVVFFLHIPWPTVEIADRVPHLKQISRSLLSADGIVFHTDAYKSHFRDFVEEAELWTTIKDGIPVAEKRLHSIPVGIAAEEFQNPTLETLKIEDRFRTPIRVIGVDRFDYSKGVDFKLLAFNDFLEMNPQYRGKIILDQLLIPTRDGIDAYKEHQSEVLSLVKFINRKFGTREWTPVNARVGRMSRDELIEFYRSGDICLITSPKDGMNLVSMEFLASQNTSNPGVLLLSDQAGASHYLKGALKFKANCLEEALKQLRIACEMSEAQKMDRLLLDLQWINSHSARKWAMKNLEILGVDVLEPVSTISLDAATT